MTLIVGLQSDDCVVIGAEQEESSGYLSKSSITKLRLITGSDWAVVVGGAGDAALAELAIRAIDKKLNQKHLNETVLAETIDEILDELYTKYVDKDRESQGLSLVVGASSSDGLYLLSTARRIPQPQDHIAHAGIGADIGLYFLNRLHRSHSDWRYLATVAGFVLQQAIESCQHCSGEAEVYVLQRPPNPRWRYLGEEDASSEFFNAFQTGVVSDHLQKLVGKSSVLFEQCRGYQDEHNPEPKRERSRRSSEKKSEGQR